MKCFFCHSTFFLASMSGPQEDCDCGQNVTAEEARTMSRDEVSERMQQAKEVLTNESN